MRTDSPFAGPKPLESSDPIYGRARELQELSDLLISRRIVLLYSPSGAGKSSMLAARGGLLDRLGRNNANGLLDVRPITRVQGEPPAGGQMNRFAWSVATGLGLVPAPSLAAAITPAIKGPTLIVFDQFEEILRTDPAALAPKREFFAQLGELLLDKRVWALFALREDYLARFDPYRILLPTRLEVRYRIDMLSRDGAREVIQQTAASAHVPFTPEAANKLLDDLSGTDAQQPDSSYPIEPLQLQLVCGEVWRNLPSDAKQIDLPDVQKFGDVSTVLRDYYEGVVRDVAGEDQYALRTWIGTQLILGRRRGQVMDGPELQAVLSGAQLQQLVDRYLLRREQRMSATWLELGHDRLVDPVLSSNAAWFGNLNEWEQRVRNWAQEKNEDLRGTYLVTGRCLHDAQAWFEQHKNSPVHAESGAFLAASEDLHKRKSARRAAIFALALLFAVACAALLWAVRANHELQQSNMFLNGEVDSLGQQHTRLVSEVDALRATHARLITSVNSKTARDAAFVPQLKALHDTGDMLLKQVRDAGLMSAQALQMQAEAIKSAEAAAAEMKEVAVKTSGSLDDLNRVNQQNRELMTRIIELGIHLPVITSVPGVVPAASAVLSETAYPPPPPFTPPSDDYLQSLLDKNAALLAQARRLSASDASLREEAAALRRQNEQLAVLEADLREQLARVEDEVKLLTATNDLRRKEVADLNALTSGLKAQSASLASASSSLQLTHSQVQYQVEKMNMVRLQIEDINKALSAAIDAASPRKPR